MVAALLAAVLALAAQELPTVPSHLPAGIRADLTATRTALIARIDAFNVRVEAFNAKCGKVTSTADSRYGECARESAEMQGLQGKLEKEKTAYTQRLDAAVASASHLNSAVVDARGTMTEGLDVVSRLSSALGAGLTEPARKGVLSARDGDWQTARAHWQGALNKDPFNATLQRIVQVADWKARRTAREASDPVAAAAHFAQFGEFHTPFALIHELRRSNPTAAAAALDVLDTKYGTHGGYIHVRVMYSLSTQAQAEAPPPNLTPQQRDTLAVLLFWKDLWARR